ncbi:hypothetical protein BVC80_1837g382 [Macleaya cordata]|uniref:Uncharacterized protein n=1 Tax=Macleaya cordata TaxID=56857 RepID=A0A200R4D1_MACCD|nr:hypothetical protein BVC80_1837g382 [Macleaya cordata]
MEIGFNWVILMITMLILSVFSSLAVADDSFVNYGSKWITPGGPNPLHNSEPPPRITTSRTFGNKFRFIPLPKDLPVMPSDSTTSFEIKRSTPTGPDPKHHKEAPIEAYP